MPRRRLRLRGTSQSTRCGVLKEDLPKLSERFHCIDASHRRCYEGAWASLCRGQRSLRWSVLGQRHQVLRLVRQGHACFVTGQASQHQASMYVKPLGLSLHRGTRHRWHRVPSDLPRVLLLRFDVPRLCFVALIDFLPHRARTVLPATAVDGRDALDQLLFSHRHQDSRFEIGRARRSSTSCSIAHQHMSLAHIDIHLHIGTLRKHLDNLARRHTKGICGIDAHHASVACRYPSNCSRPSRYTPILSNL